MIEEPAERPGGLQALAGKHGFSLPAVRHMLHALEAGAGTMAQFDHPEFGGMGQWFSGGMVMVGRMNDHGLKARVSALCADLAAALPSDAWHGGAASGAVASAGGFSSQSQARSSGTQGGFGRWWPEGLGRPASVGSQNATRYAYFPESRRLAVETNGRIALYDTGDHVVTGASQQQGGASSFRFSGPRGSFSVDELRQVEMPLVEMPLETPGHGSAPAGDRAAETIVEPVRPKPAPSPAPASTAAVAPTRPDPSSHAAPSAQADILSTLERLAELHRKGVLTDEEFSGKKAELLARL